MFCVLFLDQAEFNGNQSINQGSLLPTKSIASSKQTPQYEQENEILNPLLHITKGTGTIDVVKMWSKNKVILQLQFTD